MHRDLRNPGWMSESIRSPLRREASALALGVLQRCVTPSSVELREHLGRVRVRVLYVPARGAPKPRSALTASRLAVPADQPTGRRRSHDAGVPPAQRSGTAETGSRGARASARSVVLTASQEDTRPPHPQGGGFPREISDAVASHRRGRTRYLAQERKRCDGARLPRGGCRHRIRRCDKVRRRDGRSASGGHPAG